MTEQLAFEKIKNKIKEKKEKISNPIDLNKIQMIENMIRTRYCFLEISFNAAYGIFQFLEFDYDDMLEVYSYLSNADNFRGNFTFK